MGMVIFQNDLFAKSATNPLQYHSLYFHHHHKQDGAGLLHVGMKVCDAAIVVPCSIDSLELKGHRRGRSQEARQ